MTIIAACAVAVCLACALFGVMVTYCLERCEAKRQQG